MNTDQPVDRETPNEASDKPSRKHPVYGTEMPDEVAGPPGPEPTRYGDWEVKGRCSDF